MRAIGVRTLDSGGITHDEEVFYSSSFSFLEEVPLTTETAQQAAIWLRGLPGAFPESLARDALIAAAAMERGEPVYTRNVRDFQRLSLPLVRY